MLTKLINHNKYNSRIQLKKADWQELGFKENDKISISKLEEGKIVVERVDIIDEMVKEIIELNTKAWVETGELLSGNGDDDNV